ncbi:MAG TPA: HlyD family secretion protein [Aliidongia sp.]|uniref:HlyD family secretion protein n=1 Tax=Aliidongia sp. TaxID=1914230 RepID=UPI002DDD1FF5|nr:HlyD family secretion protein [Aliidongia sp.]HEV2677779.1 HlyD family secretion protein [Aliidongia sp.]
MPEDNQPDQEEPTEDRDRTEGNPEGEGGEKAKGKKDKDKKKKKDQPHSRWPLIALAIGIVVAIIAGVAYWFMNRNLEDTDDAFIDGRAIMVAPQVSGTVTALLVNDNQFVHKGDLLIEIDPRVFQASADQSVGQVKTAEAQLANARVALDKARVTAPAQLLAARGQLDQAKAQLVQAKAEYNRQHSIERAATSQQNIDKADAGLLQAQGQVEQAEAQVKQADLVPQNVAQAEAQVAQLEGQLLQAKASQESAAINLGYAHVTAPQDGWVTKRNVEVGDLAAPGAPIISIVSPQVWVTANFKETQLNRMRPGQHVDIRVDGYPSLRLNGHVDSVQLGSGSRFSAFPAENATGNFVKIVQRIPVKIVIDGGLNPNLPLPLGLSVTPTVTLE